MNKLKEAVRRGIISDTQRAAIEALEDPRAFRLSLVHVLWAGGVALIVFALWLLAIEISNGDSEILITVCLVYALGLATLDRVVSGRASLRLLSSMLFFGMGLCLTFAVVAWQDVVGRPTYFRDWSDIPWWSRTEREVRPVFRYHPLIHGIYLPIVPVLAVSIALVWRRGFLPVWMAICACGVVVFMDVFMNLPGFGGWDSRHVFLIATFVLCGLGWRCDLICEANHGFWFNKAGMLCFSIYALLTAFNGNESLWLLATSCLAIIFSIYVRRGSGIAAGALGAASFLAQWLDGFDNLFVGAAIVAVVGLAAIVLGVRAQLIESRLEALLPPLLRRLRPESRNDPVTFGF